MENKILKKFDVTEVEIITIDGIAMFNAYSVGMAIGHVKKAKGNLYPRKERIELNLKNAQIKPVVHNGQPYINENQLYDFLLEARTDKCREFRKWITTEVLPIINKTGGYVETNMEEEFVNNYLMDLSEETKTLVIKELHSNNERLKKENEELKDFYDKLINTEGLLPMNIVAKELNIGLKRLYSFLRTNKIMFYKGNVNTPYQRFMEQKLFEIKETPCHDGEFRPVTYATRKGVDYIRKLLNKKEYKFD